MCVSTYIHIHTCIQYQAIGIATTSCIYPYIFLLLGIAIICHPSGTENELKIVNMCN